MKFEISKSVILKALSNVNGAVEKRNTIPVLLNVKIEATNGRVNLTATDMDIVIISSSLANVNEDGSTTVPAQLFYDIVRKIPDGVNINISLSEDKTNAKIIYGKSKFTLPCLDPSEFPVLSEGEMTVDFNIKSSELIKIIDKTRFAISSDETRFYLNGLFLHAVKTEKGAQIRGIATDGHRLALASSDQCSLKEEISGVIIPRKTVNEIRKIIEGNEETQLAFSKAKIKVKSGSAVIISKLIDGEFPDYDKVIPKGNNEIVKVKRKLMFDAVDRVATIATDKNKSIKFVASDDKIMLQVTTNDGGDADEEIDAQFKGETIETGFNSKYLLEILGQINQEFININLKDGNAPALINTEDNSGLYVIMPVRI
jgi:DNA polymerase-3 subunit beta